jgi:hypothetical protein
MGGLPLFFPLLLFFVVVVVRVFSSSSSSSSCYSSLDTKGLLLWSYPTPCSLLAEAPCVVWNTSVSMSFHSKISCFHGSFIPHFLFISCFMMQCICHMCCFLLAPCTRMPFFCFRVFPWPLSCFPLFWRNIHRTHLSLLTLTHLRHGLVPA